MKIRVIGKLPQPISVNGVRTFSEHVCSYQRFIKDFSKIAQHLLKLLEKEVKFHFDDACVVGFRCLNEKLASVVVVFIPDRLDSFEVMCDASGMSLSEALGKKCNKLFHQIPHKQDFKRC